MNRFLLSADDHPIEYVSCRGRLFVNAESIMDKWILCVDELPVHHFGGDPDFYLLIGDAIAWCKHEEQRDLPPKILKTLESMWERFNSPDSPYRRVPKVEKQEP